MSASAATMAQIVFNEEFVGRNFNSSPLTISNLQGDLYDYEPVVFSGPATINTQFLIFANGDQTANYREYRLKGTDSFTNQTAVNDNATGLRFNDMTRVIGPSLLRCAIEGASGDERYSHGLHSGYDNVIVKTSNYWKNTADEITSLTFALEDSSVIDAHIVLFATPKNSAQEGWELMEILSWSSEVTPKAFTGLNGDVDGQYLVRWDSDQHMTMQLNLDGGSNYTTQSLRNASGSIVAANASTTAMALNGIVGEIIIEAESGQERLGVSSVSDTVSDRQVERANWWSNTGDNLTSLNISPAASSTGTAKLYRKRTLNHTSDTLPWETVDEVAVSGDFSAGHTFTGLEGDKDFLYRMEFVGTYGATLELRAQINSDTGSNYTHQYLRSNGALTQAATSTLTYLEFLDGQIAKVNSASLIIYPQSGSTRPAISAIYSRENRLEFRADWWTNTADEMTSIKVFGSTADTVTGTLRLSRIPRIS